MIPTPTQSMLRPIPQYPAGPLPADNLEFLYRELELERTQNLQLIRELAKERKRIQDLELKLIANARSAVVASFPRVGSSSSLASTRVEEALSGLNSRSVSFEHMPLSDVEDPLDIQNRHFVPYKPPLFENSEALPLVEPVSVVGRYPPHIRKQKIEKYKAKLQARRQQRSVLRGCQGRSVVATKKPRMKGRFVRLNATDS